LPTNVIERLNGEIRRRVKTQAALPSDDAVLSLLYGLFASGMIQLRRIDGWRRMTDVRSMAGSVAA
jgi:transposase-like protein